MQPTNRALRSTFAARGEQTWPAHYQN